MYIFISNKLVIFIPNQSKVGRYWNKENIKIKERTIFKLHDNLKYKLIHVIHTYSCNNSNYTWHFLRVKSQNKTIVLWSFKNAIDFITVSNIRIQFGSPFNMDWFTDHPINIFIVTVVYDMTTEDGSKVQACTEIIMLHTYNNRIYVPKYKEL